MNTLSIWSRGLRACRDLVEASGLSKIGRLLSRPQSLPARQPRAAKLYLEELEDRTVPTSTATIVIVPYSGIYDGQPHSLGGTATGDNNEDLSSLLTLGSRTDAGDYSVGWMFAGHADYSSASGISNIQISPAPLSMTAEGDDKVYDGTTAATLTLDLSGIRGSDDVATSDSGGTFDTKDVGTAKTITIGPVSLVGSSAANYYLANPPLTTTADITPAPLTVTAEDKTMSQGATVPALIYTTSGLLADDTVTGTLATTATSASPVGTYAITQGTLAAGNNYTLTFNDGTLTVKEKPVVIITETGGNTEVERGGATDTYTIVLSAQPSEDVIVNLSTAHPLTVSTNQLTFTSGDWDVPRVITVGAARDGLVENWDYDRDITHTVVSGDPDFGSPFLQVSPVHVRVHTNIRVTAFPVYAPPALKGEWRDFLFDLSFTWINGADGPNQDLAQDQAVVVRDQQVSASAGAGGQVAHVLINGTTLDNENVNVPTNQVQGTLPGDQTFTGRFQVHVVARWSTSGTKTLTFSMLGSIAKTIKVQDFTISPDPIVTGFIQVLGGSTEFATTITVTASDPEAVNNLQLDLPANRVLDFYSQARITRDPVLGTLTFPLAASEASVAPNDAEVRVTLNGEVVARAPLTVLIPKSFQRNNYDVDGNVSAENRVLGRTTSPRIDEIPDGQLGKFTIYMAYDTVQIRDQFGNPLLPLYAGQAVKEDNVSINQSLTGAGTYQDPLGKFQQAPGLIADDRNNPEVVAAINAWEQAVPEDFLADRSVIDEGWKTVNVSVAGHAVGALTRRLRLTVIHE